MSGEICTCYESKERDSEDVCGSWVRGEPYHVSAVNTGFTQDAPVQKKKPAYKCTHTNTHAKFTLPNQKVSVNLNS